jgi:tetratricopeptide (TPR) repeat protein
MTSCPPEAILRLIGTEAAGEATVAGLEGHVEQCPDCQNVLEAVLNEFPQAADAPPGKVVQPTLPGLVIERELGHGAASVVYLAWEPELKRHVAVKLVPKNSLVDLNARSHWLCEARALSRVPHDHVVAIHRVVETHDWLGLVLEYVSGGTLKQRLAEPLPPRDAARVIETIARTVGYFHTRGVCHLDLKPSNILLGGERGAIWESVSPKISDFGIARLEGEPGTTETGANGPKGTPSYMAPEQAAAIPGTIGPAADVYALGAVFYHLLTGRPPFQGASSVETLVQVRNQDPVAPRQFNSRIPRDLETICLKCLEKSANRRYASAESLAADLRYWLNGRPIKARRVSPMGRAWRLSRRHPAVAGLMLTLAITLATGIVGLFVLLNRVEAERAQLAESARQIGAYEQFSATTAEHLFSFLGKIFPFPRDMTSAQTNEALFEIRRSIEELKSRGIQPSSNLGIFESRIGWALLESSQNAEALDLLNQAVVDLRQSLAKNPADKDVRHHLVNSLFRTGELKQDGGQLAAALNDFEQSVAVYLALPPSEPELPLLTILYKSLLDLADQFERYGSPKVQEHALHVSRQVLQHLLGSSLESLTDGPLIGLDALGRMLQHFDVKKMLSHEDRTIRVDFERFASEWLAISVSELSPFHSPSSAAKYDQDRNTGAMALINALRERSSTLGLVDSMVPAAFEFIWHDAGVVAHDQRQANRLDDARATAARLMTLAQRLVREYPDRAISYRTLCEAYDQIKKNAMRSGDDKVVEEALVHAVEYAKRALALDPDLVEIRRKLEKFNAHLADIRAERKAAGEALSENKAHHHRRAEK